MMEFGIWNLECGMRERIPNSEFRTHNSNRRAFLVSGLIVLGIGRRVRAQLTSATVRYVPLTAPVHIPLEAVKTPWRPVPFRAEAVAPATGTAPARRVLLSGVLFRRVTGDERPELSALCVTCTHEQCQVDFIAEPTTLPRTDRVMTHPVFLCACHSSVFDAVDDGEWIAGPAPRGLFRFRVHVDADAVAIAEVEGDALFAV
jgi:Rieske Fe-S protein